MSKRASRTSKTRVRKYATRRGRRVMEAKPQPEVIDANDWLHQMIDKYEWKAQARFIKRGGPNPLVFVIVGTAVEKQRAQREKEKARSDTYVRNMVRLAFGERARKRARKRKK